MNPTQKQIRTTTKLKVDFDQVMYMVGAVNYTTLYFNNGRKEIFAYTLKIFEKNEAIMEQFKRIHKAYLVNGKYVADWQRRQVLLIGGGRLPIARRRQSK